MYRLESALRRGNTLDNLHNGATRLLAGMQELDTLDSAELEKLYWGAFERAKYLSLQSGCEQCKRPGGSHDLCRQALYAITGALVCRMDFLEPDRNPKRSMLLWAEARRDLGDADAELIKQWFNYGDHDGESPITITRPEREVITLQDPYDTDTCSGQP